ncbi:hypothetical protein HDU67_009801, partial [Dinochytrium kinnereticum]
MLNENAYMDEKMKPHRHIHDRFVTRLKHWSSSAQTASLPLPPSPPHHHHHHSNKNNNNNNSTAHARSPCQIISGDAEFWESGSHLYWIDYHASPPSTPHPLLDTLPIYKRLKLPPDFDPCSCTTTTTTPADNASSSPSQPHTPPASEQVVLDVSTVIPPNATYFAIGAFEVSSRDEDLVAVSWDLDGSERFWLHVLDLRDPGRAPLLVDREAYYSVRWAAEVEESEGRRGLWGGGETEQRHWLYFNVVDREYGIPRIVRRACVRGCSTAHCLPALFSESPSLAKESEIVYIEKDISMTTELESSTDGSFLFLKVVGQVTSEYLLLSSPTTGIHSPPQPLHLSRTPGKMYDIHPSSPTRFHIRINDGDHYNYRVILLDCLFGADCVLQPKEVVVVVPHSPDRFIEKIEVLGEVVIVWGWVRGLRRVFKTSLVGGGDGDGALLDILQDPPSLYAIHPSTLNDMDARLHRRPASSCLIYTNSSYLTPPAVYGHDLKTNHTTLLRISSLPQPPKDTYTESLRWVESTHTPNTFIPLSILHPTNPTTPTPTPFLLRSYGAYGGFQPPLYTPSLFPLLESNIAYAVCHPRGDGDNGARWYADGKFERKVNTFLDTRDCVEEVRRLGFGAPVAVWGRSAGGLVAGVAVNEWGGLVKAVVAQVPFVDPVGDLVDVK